MNREAVVDHIVNWLKEYARNSGTQGFVIGVSGGIDSAVTSSLAALTGYPVLCMEMPIHQNEDQVSRARLHIDQLKENFPNVNSGETDLTPVYDALLNQLKGDHSSQSGEMALVNTRARLRMSVLYYYAALNSYLVVGTGNKVEDFGIGFFTKYGDGGVDVSPIADLMKSEVYQLGEQLGVISDIMTAPPTDGLWGDDRSDEDQIGASYPELEWAMKEYEGGKGKEDFSGREREVMEIYIRLNKANQHKMNPIPICTIPEGLKNLSA